MPNRRQSQPLANSERSRPPTESSGEVTITAVSGDLQIQRTAVVLPVVHPDWGQPEQVPGLVNTPGYEDSAEVSPDGRWLAVLYSPLDLTQCVFGTDFSEPACDTVLGPWQAPERPDMIGGDRIISATDVVHNAPNLCVPDELGLGIPPVASYFFEAQPDGTFAAPVVTGVDNDGFTDGVYGVAFDGGDVLFAFGNINYYNAVHRAPFHDDPHIFGRYTCEGHSPVLNDFEGTVIQAINVGAKTESQGNPSIGPGGLFYDDEDADRSTDGIRLPSPIDTDGEVESMPHYHVPTQTLYYASGVTIRSSVLTSTDPLSPSSWQTPEELLGGEGVDFLDASAIGRIWIVGEPSIAVVDGEKWMYFVYHVVTEPVPSGGRPFGLDVAVGRVRAR